MKKQKFTSKDLKTLYNFLTNDENYMFSYNEKLFNTNKIAIKHYFQFKHDYKRFLNLFLQSNYYDNVLSGYLLDKPYVDIAWLQLSDYVWFDCDSLWDDWNNYVNDYYNDQLKRFTR